MNAKKIFRQLHLWLSVPFGIIISIICFSGAMLVFETEITSVIKSDFTSVRPEGQPQDFRRLIRNVGKTLPDTVEITGVTISSDTTKAYQFSLSAPRRASVYVDQYTGNVYGRNERLPFFQTMFGLHRWLLMAPTGKTIVGVSTLVFVLILISGIVVWWPRNKRAFKNGV